MHACLPIEAASLLPLPALQTIEVLGLILANPAPPFPPEGRHRDGSYRTAGGLIKSRATLVVSGQCLREAAAALPACCFRPTPGKLAR